MFVLAAQAAVHVPENVPVHVHNPIIAPIFTMSSGNFHEKKSCSPDQNEQLFFSTL